ncbi:MAG: hypothetical protein AVDCRST_MAG67-4363 [uncultured Solirubrobacteraceae bacterium]|uniref:Uncharacterized protein n=1 Tax=uncultured Solirubrobacteraceae bacterium TaxID=1162706 RepID=A0A6J4TUK2_9ACTN|nr:MAG: hypothetical protein AVDCRST_MAG67-4363 [uncultured Solirubrobacteraceae bacterium]
MCRLVGKRYEAHATEEDAVFDEDPASEGDEQVGIDNARSPAPDAAPEDNPEPDALAGDVDIKSGTGDPELAYPEQEGEAGPASGHTPGSAGGG